MSSGGLTHLDATGAARMVDVSGKPETQRTAVASSAVQMQPSTLALITSGRVEKGDVLAVARVAGIMAAKRTGDLIPLCHPLDLESVSVTLEPDGATRLAIRASATVTGRTGVEMEALTAAVVAALTVYDMCKAVDRSMVITDACLETKTGGRRGDYVRAARPPSRPPTPEA